MSDATKRERPAAVTSRALSEVDDHLHGGRTNDSSWTETCWFAASEHERSLGVWVYPMWRPELGVMSAEIYVWAPGAEEFWRLPYFRTWRHIPMPEGMDPTNFTTPDGLSYERLEPLQAYRITFADDDLQLDLTFQGLHPAHGVGVTEHHGHLDQLGHVTGELVLAGERIEIDSFDIRDRSWSARRESRQRAYITYSYGTSSATEGFHLSTRHDHRRGEMTILSGFRLAAGVVRPFVEGHCELERDDDGRPLRIHVSAKGPDNLNLEAVGDVLSRVAQPTTPWWALGCIVRWELSDGTVMRGQHLDTWAPAAFRAFLAGRSARPAQ